MCNLDKEHYNSIVARGLISEKTKLSNFISKIDEEFKELKLEVNGNIISEKLIQEAVDLRQVVSNMLIHFDVDIEKNLKKNIDYQLNRK